MRTDMKGGRPLAPSQGLPAIQSTSAPTGEAVAAPSNDSTPPALKARARALVEASDTFFGAPPTAMGYGPGRSVLLGEHVDRQRGASIGVALAEGMLVAARPTDDGSVRVRSMDYGNGLELSIADAAGSPYVQKGEPQWGKYVRALLEALTEHLVAKEGEAGAERLVGFEAVMESNLPAGAGASSSAAMLLVLGQALDAFGGLGLSKDELITVAQKAEWKLGASVGRLDQSVIAYAEAGRAVSLDFDTGAVETLPLDLGPYQLVMCAAGTERNLTDGKYDERLAWVSEGFARLKEALGRPELQSPREVSWELWQSVADKLPDDEKTRALRHVVSELRRVEEAKALFAEPVSSPEEKLEQLRKLGALIDACHASLAGDHDAGWPQGSKMVELARGFRAGEAVDALGAPAVLAARQVGAGWGGNTFALVHKDVVQDFVREVEAQYLAADESRKPGSDERFQPMLFVSQPSAGLRTIENWN